MYEVPLSVSLLGFGIGTMLANFHVCCVFDSVCELFGETIRNVFGCSCYFTVECYGSV